MLKTLDHLKLKINNNPNSLATIDEAFRIQKLVEEILSKKFQLFSKLPKDLVEKLYELYKIDFEMFQYNPKPYGVTEKLD